MAIGSNFSIDFSLQIFFCSDCLFDSTIDVVIEWAGCQGNEGIIDTILPNITTVIVHLQPFIYPK